MERLTPRPRGWRRAQVGAATDVTGSAAAASLNVARGSQVGIECLRRVPVYAGFTAWQPPAHHRMHRAIAERRGVAVGAAAR